MDTYQSGEIPSVNDVVRFNDLWLTWWLFGGQTMIVSRMGYFPSGKNYVVVGYLLEDKTISEIFTRWNPGSFIKI